MKWKKNVNSTVGTMFYFFFIYNFIRPDELINETERREEKRVITSWNLTKHKFVAYVIDSEWLMMTLTFLISFRYVLIMRYSESYKITLTSWQSQHAIEFISYAHQQYCKEDKKQISKSATWPSPSNQRFVINKLYCSYDCINNIIYTKRYKSFAMEHCH